MIITQIPDHLGALLQFGILLPSITASIRHPAIQLQPRGRRNTHNIQRQARAKARLESRRLGRDEHVTRHEIPAIAEPDHEARRESGFSVAAHVVGEPGDQDRHLDVGGGGDGEHAEVAGRHGFDLHELDGPPDDANGGAEDEEAVAVTETAGEIGADEEGAEGDDVDGDGVDLGFGVRVA